MKRIVRGVVGTLLGLGLAATALAGQRTQAHHGFWLGFGGGYGSADVSCRGCGNTSRLGSFSGFLKMGGTLSQQVLLGGEVNGWSKKSSGITEYLGNASVALYVYPWAEQGFFIKGGGGAATYATSGPGPDLKGTGWGALAGIGYDIRVARNVSVTPVANVYFGRPGDLTSGGTTVVRAWKQNVFDIGVGVTFH